jgi:hypothetical protein
MHIKIDNGNKIKFSVAIYKKPPDTQRAQAVYIV